MRQEAIDGMRESMVKFDIEQLKMHVATALTRGVPPRDIIGELSAAMTEIGEKFSKGDLFLTDLLMAGEMMKEAMEIIRPHIKGQVEGELGKVVIGSAEGDVHDIGKNLVATFLSSAGFQVYDMGVDVASGDFVDKVREVRADVLAISALLTTTAAESRVVINELKNAGIRDGVKVIIGGAATTPELARNVGADACGADAFDGLEICKRWMDSRHQSKQLPPKDWG